MAPGDEQVGLMGTFAGEVTWLDLSVAGAGGCRVRPNTGFKSLSRFLLYTGFMSLSMVSLSLSLLVSMLVTVREFLTSLLTFFAWVTL